MKYKYSFKDILNIGFTEDQVIRFVRLGKLIPDEWEKLTTVQQFDFIKNRTLLFSKPAIDNLLKDIAESYLQNYAILDRLQNIELRLDNLDAGQTKLFTYFENVHLPMDLREIGSALGYSPQTLLNYINTWIKNHYPDNKKIYFAKLELPGISLQVTKHKKWICERVEFWRQFRELKYNHFVK